MEETESERVREGFLEEGLPPAEEATQAKSACVDGFLGLAADQVPPTAVDI